MHCQYARNGDTLFLTSRKGCGFAFAGASQADFCQRFLYALTKLRVFYAQVFRAECHVVFNEAGDNLVIGVLKYRTCRAANSEGVVWIVGFQAVHGYGAGVGHQECVDKLRER